MSGKIAPLSERIAKFIENQRIVHDGKYSTPFPDQYKDNKTKILIHCNVCGNEFMQRPGDHIINKSGCPECKKKTLSGLKNKSGTYIDRFNDTHGVGTYNYNLCVFGNSEDKVEIGCNVEGHANFWQTPYAHYSGAGCPMCWEDKRHGILMDRNTSGISEQLEVIEQFIKVHGNFYIYDDVIYTGMRNKIKIKCPKHSFFEQTPANHISGCGCMECANEARTKDTEFFIEKSEKLFGVGRYLYPRTIYTKAREPITITCPIEGHGDFTLNKAHYHITCKNGCPKCAHSGKSATERELIDFLQSLTEYTVLESKKIPNSDYEMDGWIPELNLAVEFNGLYWHSESKGRKDMHINKTNLCEAAGIRLIHVYEDDWLYKRSIVEDRLRNLLRNNSIRIYARTCVVKLVDYKTSEKFLIDNHIQGNCTSKHRYGLYHNDELVSLMTLGKTRANLSSIDVGYELLRFCNKSGHSVVGAASRLYSAFLKECSPLTVISYADRSWSSALHGTVYDSLGFKFAGVTKPNYFYFDSERKRLNRYSFRKDVLVSEGYDEKSTEFAIMDSRGYERIWNSGNLKYIWTKPN